VDDLPNKVELEEMMMKISKLVAGAAFACLVAGSASAAASLGINKPAPDFSATDVNGKVQSLKQHRGKIVVIEWIDPDCSYDNKHYRAGNIPTMQKKAEADGVVWLSVNSAGRGLQGDLSGAPLNNWLKEVKWNGDSYIRDNSGQVGRAFHATATPSMYIIDKQGVLRYAGAIDSIPSQDMADIPKAKNYVVAALAEIQAGKPVTKPVTRPYGCTVKYGSVIGQ